jgi:hypothetical protein
MKNIKVIDLTMFNNEKLKEVVKLFPNIEINPESLVQDKKNGIKKMFLDTESLVVIGYTLKSNPDEMIFTENYITGLQEIQPLQLPKKQRATGPLSVDTILDKISKWGIESLTESEKSFLDNSNS